MEARSRRGCSADCPPQAASKRPRTTAAAGGEAAAAAARGAAAAGAAAAAARGVAAAAAAVCGAEEGCSPSAETPSTEASARPQSCESERDSEGDTPREAEAPPSTSASAAAAAAAAGERSAERRQGALRPWAPSSWRVRLSWQCRWRGVCRPVVSAAASEGPRRQLLSVRSSQGLSALHDPFAALPAAALFKVFRQLSCLPPLVSASEVTSLLACLSQAQQREAFLLQGGPCAERFCCCREDTLSKTARMLLQLGALLEALMGVPVCVVGRLAGQYGKPRTQSVESHGGEVVLTYRGDAVNSEDPSLRPCRSAASQGGNWELSVSVGRCLRCSSSRPSLFFSASSFAARSASEALKASEGHLNGRWAFVCVFVFHILVQTPNAKRMLGAYFHSAATLNCLRRLLAGESLRGHSEVTSAAQEGHLESPLWEFNAPLDSSRQQQVTRLLASRGRGRLQQMRPGRLPDKQLISFGKPTKQKQTRRDAEAAQEADGEEGERACAERKACLYTSHEAILLPYEEALTRQVASCSQASRPPAVAAAAAAAAGESVVCSVF
ncbi:hypothetical protein Efla_005160 [Eimeria flavescens]